jgi:Flp pilus assembly protein TadG
MGDHALREGTRRRSTTQSGAAAVELLIVFPILFTLLVGIIEFGAVFNAQISLTQATREGVRVGAIGETRTVGAMQARMQEAYGGVGGVVPTAGGGSVACSGDLNSGSAVLFGQMTYTPPFEFFGSFNLSSEAEMRCGG